MCHGEWKPCNDCRLNGRDDDAADANVTFSAWPSSTHISIASAVWENGQPRRLFNGGPALPIKACNNGQRVYTVGSSAM